MESEQHKLQSVERKVRFDLNHEVFLIPNKWDRLSKAASGEKSVVEAVSGTTAKKTRPQNARDSRKKSKHKRQPASKKGIFDSPPAADDSGSKYTKNTNSRTPTPSKEKAEGRKLVSGVKESVSSPTRLDSKFKLSHRTAKELPRVDIVLPKISYTPDLKKAIEIAIQRSNKPTHRDENTEGFQRQRRMSDGSLETGSDFEEVRNKPLSPESTQELSEVTFSELSQRVDNWSPFPAWREANMTQVLRERGKALSSLIPNSILY